MKKVLIFLILILLIIPFKSQAATIADGDLIRATGTFDVYIVKIIGAKKFKRLILNPDIFNQYGHLKWENVKDVSQAFIDEYTTSTLVREIDDTKVYKLYPNGDVGEKRWVETLDCFNSQKYDWDSVYIINKFERDSYTTGAGICGVGTAPEAPILTDPGESVGKGKSFEISWTSVGGATLYTLERDINSLFTNPTSVYSGSSISVSETLSPSATTDYYFRAKAANDYGESSWSNTVDIQVISRSPITINVPSDYSTIQAAINEAIDGDTISVANGTYNENITISKGIKLIGESFGSTIIDGGGSDNAVTITDGQDNLADGSQVLIQKFTIKSEDKYGIYCLGENSISATFKNNAIIESFYGIFAESDCNLTILNNLIYANKNSSNTDGAGILVKDNISGVSTEIRNNVITDNYHGIWAEDADLVVLNNIIVSNIGGKGTIDNTGIYHIGSGESDNTYNDVWGNGDNYGGDAVAGNGSLVVDPKFVDVAHRNYHLTVGVSAADNSPCIDKGHPDFIYYDGTLITGTNYRNDMGAYGGPDNVWW